jgi:hypothetical protein
LQDLVEYARGLLKSRGLEKYTTPFKGPSPFTRTYTTNNTGV